MWERRGGVENDLEWIRIIKVGYVRIGLRWV